MSGRVQPWLFFLSLPDPRKLVVIPLSLQGEEEEPRSRQIKICRELILLYPDILASPALDSFTDITVVLAVSFFQKGILQVYAQRHSLQLGSPQYVLPGVLQCCLSYSLITRLAPSWNKAGLFLVSGRDFLTEKGRMNAVSMELSTTQGQLCISIGANAVRMPPNTLEDFGLPPLVLQRFNSDPDSILDPSSTGAAIWCHVLPSMKKGQIITISRQLPRDGPFRTYRDLQNHWNRLYGYRLPEVPQEELVYCSVYFRPVGDRLFTYPLSCIRLQPAQPCPPVNLEGALGSFASDIRTRLQSVCGFPARLSGRPSYHTVGLNAAATVQELSAEQVHLTASSTTRQVLTQLPAPPAHRTVKPLFASQPPPWTLLSQQDQAQGLTQTQGVEEDKNQPLSSISFSRVSHSSSCQTVLSLSTSFPPLLQPVSSLTSSVSPSPLPPLSQHPPNPAPKLVPVFRNKRPLCLINPALLRLQKLQQQQRGNDDRRKVIVPTFGKSEPSTLASSSVFLPIPPPPMVPGFEPKTQSSSTREPSAQLQHVFSLSPALKSKPGFVLPSKAEIKSILKTRSDSNTVTKSSSRPPAASPEAPQPSPSSVVSKKPVSSSIRGGVVFGSKVKKPRAMIQDLDVEKMARNSQLSKLKSATLVAWLKERGVAVSTKCKKEQLMLKVMACLAEA